MGVNWDLFRPAPDGGYVKWKTTDAILFPHGRDMRKSLAHHALFKKYLERHTLLWCLLSRLGGSILGASNPYVVVCWGELAFCRYFGDSGYILDSTIFWITLGFQTLTGSDKFRLPHTSLSDTNICIRSFFHRTLFPWRLSACELYQRRSFCIRTLSDANFYVTSISSFELYPIWAWSDKNCC